MQTRAGFGRGALDGVDPDRLGDVLDALRPERAEAQVELVPDLLVHGLRQAYPAGGRQRLQARGDIDAVAVQSPSAATITSPRLTPMRSSKSAPVGDTRVQFARVFLNFDRAGEGIDDARKIRQQSVPGGRNDPPAAPRDDRVDRGAQPGQRLIGAALVGAHQPAETGDVGAQQRRELATLAALSAFAGRFYRRLGGRAANSLLFGSVVIWYTIHEPTG